MSGSCSRLRFGAPLAAALLVGACGGGDEADQDVGIPADAPAAISPARLALPAAFPISEDSAATLIDAMAFDESMRSDTTFGAAVAVSERPVAALRAVTREMLGAGMFISRMEVRGGDVPEQGIRAGVWNTWVDSTQGGWRAVQIPEAGSGARPEVLDFSLDPDSLPDPVVVVWMPGAGGILAICDPCRPFWCTRHLQPF